MKQFNDDNFLLQTETAQRLYHDHAAKMPIIDYHCHLIPEYVASDHRFDNLSKIWLEGDHYKWRAMRTNGVDEKYCTGKDTTDWEKFEKWAETVPYTMRNPLYHWTHLELKTAFGVTKLLNPASAREIYDHCTALLQRPEYHARGLMRRYNVEAVCTTDDPVDSLEHHIKVREDGFATRMLPTWRPDKAMAVEVPADFRAYMEKLSEVSGVAITKFADVIDALRVRHEFFGSVGCRLSDHGIEEFYAEDYTQAEIDAIFNKVYGGQTLTPEEIRKFKTAMLVEFATMDHEAGWTQQFHYGAIRNNNSRMFGRLGPDTGFDSIGDFTVGRQMSKFFDMLDRNDRLAKTIIYNLNPRDNELVATMIGNFQDGRYGAGKIQFGSGVVVPRSEGRHGETDERPLDAGSVEPLRGHADRLAVVPFVPAPRVFPPHAVQPRRQRHRAGPAARLGDRLHRPGDHRGHLLPQRQGLFQILSCHNTMKIVTLGEIMLRLSTPGNTRFVQSDSFDVVYGGGEANVAVSCANYGHEAYFVSKLPKHEIGQSAVNALRKYGVRTDFIARGGDRVGIYYLETGASMRPSKVIYDRAHSSIAEADPQDFDFDAIMEGADWFHWSGITPAISDKAAELTRLACEAPGVTA